MANEKQPTTSASKVRDASFDWRFRGIIATLASLSEPFYPNSPSLVTIPRLQIKFDVCKAGRLTWIHFFCKFIVEGQKILPRDLTFETDLFSSKPKLFLLKRSSTTESSLAAGMNLNSYRRHSPETKTWYVVCSESFCEFQTTIWREKKTFSRWMRFGNRQTTLRGKGNKFYVRFSIQFHFWCFSFIFREFIFRNVCFAGGRRLHLGKHTLRSESVRWTYPGKYFCIINFHSNPSRLRWPLRTAFCRWIHLKLYKFTFCGRHDGRMSLTFTSTMVAFLIFSQQCESNLKVDSAESKFPPASWIENPSKGMPVMMAESLSRSWINYREPETHFTKSSSRLS